MTDCTRILSRNKEELKIYNMPNILKSNKNFKKHLLFLLNLKDLPKKEA